MFIHPRVWKSSQHVRFVSVQKFFPTQNRPQEIFLDIIRICVASNAVGGYSSTCPVIEAGEHHSLNA